MKGSHRRQFHASSLNERISPDRYLTAYKWTSQPRCHTGQRTTSACGRHTRLTKAWSYKCHGGKQVKPECQTRLICRHAQVSLWPISRATRSQATLSPYPESPFNRPDPSPLRKRLPANASGFRSLQPIVDSVVFLNGCGRDGAHLYRRALARCRRCDVGVFLGVHQVRACRRHCALTSTDRRCDANVAPRGLLVILPGTVHLQQGVARFSRVCVHVNGLSGVFRKSGRYRTPSKGRCSRCVRREPGAVLR